MPRPLLALLLARATIEAVLFAALAALVHAFAGPREPIGLAQAFALLLGCELVAISALREIRAQRQTAWLAVLAIGGAVAAGLLLPSRAADAPTILVRAIGFAILGETFLWRALTIARGLARWSAVRSSGALALLFVGLAVFVPFVDRDALPLLALVALTATGVGLSLARSTEELELAGAEARGGIRGGTALGTSLALGVLAIAVAAAAPSLQDVVGRAADVVGPLLGSLLFYLLLPFGYLAAYLVELFRGIPFFGFVPPQPPSQEQLDRDEEMRRAVLETRPIVVIGVELLVAVAAILVAILLVERMRRERRAELAAGATIEREATSGMSVRDMLASLLPSRAPRRRPPADDGSPAAAVRLLYWRLLELAERGGIGWRADAETPAEHAARLERAGEPWRAAPPIVRAFELVRYGEAAPSDPALAAARSSLREIESYRPH